MINLNRLSTVVDLTLWTGQGSVKVVLTLRSIVYQHGTDTQAPSKTMYGINDNLSHFCTKEG